MKVCEYCDRTVGDNEQVCPSCMSTSFKNKCERCGTIFDTDSCPNCTAKDNQAARNEEERKSREAASAKANSGLVWKTALTVFLPFIGGYFLVNRNTKAGFRVFGFVWCLLIAISVSVGTSTALAKIIASILCLAPVAVYLFGSKGENWVGIVSEKAARIAFCIVLILSILLGIATSLPKTSGVQSSASVSTAVSNASSSSQPVAKAVAKPAKNGFEEGTFPVEIANVTFQIPTCFTTQAGESTNNSQTFVAESSGNAFAMLGIRAIYDAAIPNVDFLELTNYIVREILDGIGASETNAAETQNVKVAGLPGYIVSGTGKMNNGVVEWAMLTFRNNKTSSIGIILLLQSDESQFDYIPDFKRIVESAEDRDATAVKALENCKGLAAKAALETAVTYDYNPEFKRSDGSVLAEGANASQLISEFADAIVTEVTIQADNPSGKSVAFVLDVPPEPEPAAASQDEQPPAEEQPAATADDFDSDLAALLSVHDPGDPIVATFAAKYAGREIEFDGNIQSMAKHGSNKTRYDVLIGVGDYNPDSMIGPNFYFRDINWTSDPKWEGEPPDKVGVGANLHFVARVERFDEQSELFYLRPVKTSAR